MSNSPSQTPAQNALEPVAAGVITESKPESVATASAKKKSVVKRVRTPAASTAKVAKPTAVVAAPVVSKTPARTRRKAPVAATIKAQAAEKTAKHAVDEPAAIKAVAEPAAPVAKEARTGKSKDNKDSSESKAGKEKKNSGKKPKLIRDSFTFPEADYALIGILKQRALKVGFEVKKSELLRAGLIALAALSDASLLKVMESLDKLKPGRPAK